MMLSISLAQMHIQLGAVEVNYNHAETLLSAAVQRSSHLILFPELWTSGYDLENSHQHARTNLEILNQLSAEATQQNIFIGGSYLLERAGSLYNTFVLLAPGGKRWQYEKIHLFRLMDEHLWLSPGDQVAAGEVHQNQAGIAICYDLRFPELFRQYAISGAALMLLSAEWPAKRRLHWQVLLRARAIENQFFLAAVNNVGTTGGETFGGSSAVISPWGEVLVEGSATDEDLLTAAVDLEEVSRVRTLIPILSDRRPDIYG